VPEGSAGVSKGQKQLVIVFFEAAGKIVDIESCEIRAESPSCSTRFIRKQGREYEQPAKKG
jgi:hypothetical protein